MTLSAPSTGDMLKPEEVHGHLLIIHPTEFLPQVNTIHGARDAIRVNVCDINATNPDGSHGVASRDVLWFGSGLVPGLKRDLTAGRTVLARMGQGIAKGGQNPPWQLEDATGDPQALAWAQTWLTAHPDFDAPPQASTAQPPSGPPAPAVPPAAPVPSVVPATPPMVATQTVPAPTLGAVPAAASTADPWSLLSPEQKAALESIGFTRA